MRTALALLSVQGVTWVSTLVSISVLPRFLGAEQFGFSVIASTAVTMAAMVAAFGTSNLLVRETARRPERSRVLLVNGWALRLAFWAVLCAISTPLVILFVDSRTFAVVLLISAAGGLAAVLQDAAICTLRGLERVGAPSVGLALLALAGTFTAAGVLVAGGGVVEVTLTSVAITWIGLVLVSVSALRCTSGSLRPQRREILGLTRSGPPFLAWELGLKLYATVDLLILSMLVGATSVGGYALAYRIVGIPVFATTIITMAVFPSLAATAMNDPAWFRKVVSNASRLVFAATAPMSTGLAVLASQIIQMISGSQFISAEILVVILALHIPPAAIHTVLGMAVFARDGQKSMALLAWAAVAGNIGLNVALIPISQRMWGDGAIGAALVTVITEFAMGAVVWHLAWSYFDHRVVFSGILKTLLSCAIMAATVLAIGPYVGLFIGVIVGGIVYVAASAAVGALAIQDVRRLLSEARSQAALTSVES